MATIYSIVYQTEKSVRKPPFRYNRTPIDTANLVLGYGIEGDMKGGKSEAWQLNIMSYETLQDLTAIGFSTQPGEMGEQIVIAA